MQRRSRKGALLTEVSMAAVVATVAIVGVVQLVFSASNQLRKRENQALIVREVGNLMEDLYSRSWSELTTDQPPILELSDELQERVPEAELEIAIELEEARASTLRITIRVTAPPHSNQTTGPVRLVAWRERVEEESP